MAIGSLGGNGSPVLKIKLSGPFTDAKEFDCLVDTGFTGFLSVPLVEALPLGLVLVGTMSLSIADGTIVNRLTCLGLAELEGKKVTGSVIVESGGNVILLGMEFLSSFGLKLMVCPTSGHVEVCDHQSTFSPPPPPAPAAAPTATP